MKETEEETICWEIRKQKLAGLRLNYVQLEFKWFEKDKKRDKDNISSMKKFILDSMQKTSVIENDNWKHISGFTDEFYIDADNPRIEVIITEIN